jgi:S-formylglutathione hydrolase
LHCGWPPGAGFYVNATQEPWNANFHMYDYVTKELPEVVGANFPVDTANGVCPSSQVPAVL